MRKISFALSFCFLLFTLSCAKEEVSSVDVDIAQETISASVEGASDIGSTRMYLNLNNGSVYWADNDKITVVSSDSKCATFTLTDGSGTTSGTFSGTKSGTGPFYAVMPVDSKAAVSDTAVTFSIPQKKGAYQGNIAKSVNPIAGKLVGNSVQFHNLFGLLKMTFKCSEGNVTVKKIALHDLGGNMLWGTCTIPIQDDTLAYSQISLSGGDNTINMVWSTPVQLTSSVEKSYYFPIPPGSLDKGFSMVIYEYDSSQSDGVGRAWTFIQKVSSPVTAERSVVININTATLTEKSEPKDVKARGYYKSLFVDAGYGLTQYYTTNHLPWIPDMSLSNDYEYFAGSENGGESSIAKQTEILYGSESDANGVLLYPDSSPRFRMVYVNGGSSDEHGESLGHEGCERFHQFFYRGGSYVGTCAGSFMATTWYTIDSGKSTYNRYENTTNNWFTFGIWPGTIRHTCMPAASSYKAIYTAAKALKTFAGISEGDTLELLKHHLGSYMPHGGRNENIEGAEELFSFQFTEQVQANCSTADGVNAAGHSYNEANLGTAIFGNSSMTETGKYSPKVDSTVIWAYKHPDGKSGRAILCGSHPEGEKYGKKLSLMEGMVSYALSGCGNPPIKQSLVFGDIVTMNESESRIGDRQYHHFTFEMPSGGGGVKIVLNGIGTEANLYLALKKGGYAWMSDADYVICTSGNSKTLNIKSLPEGTWYVSVYCASTVEAIASTEESGYVHCFVYTDKMSVLNGAAYSLSLYEEGEAAQSLPSLPGVDVGYISFSMDD